MSDPLETLLRSVRRRVWGEQTRTALRQALLVAGTIAVIAGIVHRWLFTLPPLTALIIVLVPAAGFAIRAIARGRPSLMRCARVADRSLGSQDLLTSAWEISRRREDRGLADPLVLARARSCAAQVEPSDWPEPAAQRFGTLALATALTIAGTFLLLNRGANPDDGFAARSTTPADSTTASPVGPEPSVALGPATRPGEERERPTVETDGVIVPDPLDEGPEPLLLPDVGAAGAGAGSELGKLATDDRPGPRLAGEVELAEMEVRVVTAAAIESAPELTTGSDGVELDEAGAVISGSTNGGAVAATGTLSEWNRLTAGQRRLADRFFELGRNAAGNDEEPGR